MEKTREPLFRQEAIDELSKSKDSRPILIAPTSWSIITGLIGIITLVSIIALFTASYSRKESIPGLLRSENGDLRIIPQFEGTIMSINVNEGDIVQAGQVLCVISTTRTFASGVESEQVMIEAIDQQYQSLSNRLQALNLAEPLELSSLIAREQSLISELEATALKIDSASELEQLSQNRIDAIQNLLSQGFITQNEATSRRESMLMYRQSRAEAIAERQSLISQISQVRSDIERHPYETVQERERIEESLANLRARRAQFEADSAYAISAATSGRITSMQAAVGQNVNSQIPIMTITPTGSELVAELHAPSRTIGFIIPGQRVRLLYDAFPYQRFGAASGRVERVSESILSPEEVIAPYSVDEPVYRVIVRLDKSTVSAYGSEVDLQTGMALSADIIMEERSFIEWLFEPLIAARGRL